MGFRYGYTAKVTLRELTQVRNATQTPSQAPSLGSIIGWMRKCGASQRYSETYVAATEAIACFN